MNGTCPSKLLKSLVALALIIVVTLASSSPLCAFSYEDERNVGKEIYDSIKDAGFLVEDEELNAYINEIGHRLVKQGDQYPLDFTFSIIRSSESMPSPPLEAIFIFLLDSSNWPKMRARSPVFLPMKSPMSRRAISPE